MHIRQSYITVFTRSTNHQHLDRKMLIVTFCWVTWAGSMWEDFFPSTFSSWEFIAPQLSSCIAFFNAWATSSKVGSFATAACGVATGRPCGFSLREDACCWASTTCKFNLAGLIGPKSVDWRWKNDRNSPHPQSKAEKPFDLEVFVRFDVCQGLIHRLSTWPIQLMQWRLNHRWILPIIILVQIIIRVLWPLLARFKVLIYSTMYMCT